MATKKSRPPIRPKISSQHVDTPGERMAIQLHKMQVLASCISNGADDEDAPLIADCILDLLAACLTIADEVQAAEKGGA